MDFNGFQPFIDGLNITQQEHFKQFQTLPNPSFFEEIKSDILGYIRQNYLGAIPAYEIEPWLSGWSKMSMGSQGILSIGLYFMVMDYYHAKKVIPRRFKNLQSKRRSNFQTYLKKRTDEGIRIKTANQLKAVTISALMPDSWIGENSIAEKVKEVVQSTGYYTKVKVDFDLHIPLSGKNWLKNKKVMEWEKLKKALDVGCPQIVTYIIYKGKYFPADKTGIAYAYKIGKRKNIEISMYDLADGAESNRININLDESRKISIGGISAFYIEEYEPYNIRNSSIGGWFDAIISIPFWWYLKRIYILLMHQIFSLSKTVNQFHGFWVLC